VASATEDSMLTRRMSRRLSTGRVCGVLAICDRLPGGAEAIQAAAGDAPYVALTTIDDVYPERPDGS
jgi:hypothetical protein